MTVCPREKPAFWRALILASCLAGSADLPAQVAVSFDSAFALNETQEREQLKSSRFAPVAPAPRQGPLGYIEIELGPGFYLHYRSEELEETQEERRELQRQALVYLSRFVNFANRPSKFDSLLMSFNRAWGGHSGEERAALLRSIEDELVKLTTIIKIEGVAERELALIYWRRFGDWREGYKVWTGRVVAEREESLRRVLSHEQQALAEVTQEILSLRNSFYDARRAELESIFYRALVRLEPGAPIDKLESALDETSRTLESRRADALIELMAGLSQPRQLLHDFETQTQARIAEVESECLGNLTSVGAEFRASLADNFNRSRQELRQLLAASDGPLTARDLSQLERDREAIYDLLTSTTWESYRFTHNTLLQRCGPFVDQLKQSLKSYEADFRRKVQAEARHLIDQVRTSARENKQRVQKAVRNFQLEANKFRNEYRQFDSTCSDRWVSTPFDQLPGIQIARGLGYDLSGWRLAFSSSYLDTRREPLEQQFHAILLLYRLCRSGDAKLLQPFVDRFNGIWTKRNFDSSKFRELERALWDELKDLQPQFEALARNEVRAIFTKSRGNWRRYLAEQRNELRVFVGRTAARLESDASDDLLEGFQLSRKLTGDLLRSSLKLRGSIERDYLKNQSGDFAVERAQQFETIFVDALTLENSVSNQLAEVAQAQSARRQQRVASEIRDLSDRLDRALEAIALLDQKFEQELESALEEQLLQVDDIYAGVPSVRSLYPYLSQFEQVGKLLHRTEDRLLVNRELQDQLRKLVDEARAELKPAEPAIETDQSVEIYRTFWELTSEIYRSSRAAERTLKQGLDR